MQTKNIKDPKRIKDILQKVRRIEINTRRLVDGPMAGRYGSVFKGQGLHFEEVREYVPGDEVRTIDWNVTARAGHPFVKVFTEERELTLLIAVDISASGSFGSGEHSKRELAAEVASVLAFSAARNQDKVGLVLFTDRVELYVPPQKGRVHALRIIREILAFQPEHKGTQIDVALDFIGRILSRKAVLLVVSDFQIEGDRERAKLQLALELTRRRHDVIALRVTDPRESEILDVGIIALEDAETKELVELDTHSAEIREAFAKRAHERVEAIGKIFLRAQIDTLEIGTDVPYLSALLGFFKRRQHRRAS